MRQRVALNGIQSGVITPAMKRAIVITSLLTLCSAMALIYYAFTNTIYFVLLVLGILAIFSAIRYTVGNTAYGYRGWRSICFIFFGLVSVGFFLYSKQIDAILVLPAVALVY
jgi:1,4-dihydroxy-2-naphthoate octaprenyltransferase